MKLKYVTLILVIISTIFISGCLQQEPIGGETDEHGCMLTAGYTWCELKQQCLREWEEPCEGEPAPVPPIVPEPLTIEQAMEIAQESECTEKGELTEEYSYNGNSKTWWIDLDMKEEFEKEYCSPACVVKEYTGTAEINWRCTGVLLSCAEDGEQFSAVYDKYLEHCCEGLKEWIAGMDKRLSIADECYETGIPSGLPVGICIACGDGVCGNYPNYSENPCNCPEDCAGKNKSHFSSIEEFCQSNDWNLSLSKACEETIKDFPICKLC